MAYPYPDALSGADEVAWKSVVDSIREYCGWHIAPVFTETVTVDGPGGPELTLPTQRVKEVHSISNDGRMVSNPEWSEAGLVRGGWTGKYRGVVVTMTHGFDVWPTELSTLATGMLAFADRVGVRAVQNGSHQVQFESGLTTTQLSTLDRYRLRAEP